MGHWVQIGVANRKERSRRAKWPRRRRALHRLANEGALSSSRALDLCCHLAVYTRSGSRLFDAGVRPPRRYTAGRLPRRARGGGEAFCLTIGAIVAKTGLG